MLVLQAGYRYYSIGIATQDGALIAHAQGDKQNTNKELLVVLDQLLNTHAITLHQIGVIGINLGPGPFTSVRVAVTLANALSYALNIPLIGHNNIQEIVKHYATPTITTIALLDAYNHDLYYAIATPDTAEISMGYENKEKLLHTLAAQFPYTQLHFIGAGTTIVTQEIQHLFQDRAIIMHKTVDESTLAHLAQQTAAALAQQRTSTHPLMPLYLKSVQYKPVC